MPDPRQFHPPVGRDRKFAAAIASSRLHRARLIVDVINDEAIEPVLDDLRKALMQTGHGPRIAIETISPFRPPNGGEPG